MVSIMKEGPRDKFQEKTKYRRGSLPKGRLDWTTRPSKYKDYEGAEKISLNDPQEIELNEKDSLNTALNKRRSVRDFSPYPLNVDEISYLIWATAGIQRERSGEYRTAPSAGALYPIETYVIINRVSGIEEGIYHYDIREHGLELIRSGDYGRRLARASLDQRMCEEAAAVIALTGVFDRCKWKYRQRAYRYIYLEAGHMAQNLALSAASLGLGTVQIGALYDDEVNSLLEIDGETESILYLNAVGRPSDNL